VPNAQVFDVAANKCLKRDIALVGFHIVTKTPDRPQWIWSSFEQIDNVPGLSSEPKPPSGVPLSFNDPSKPQSLDPKRSPPPISPTNPPVVNPPPMQVVRQQKISDETIAMNRAYWALPEIKGTVWENYMLIMTQWPTQISPEQPSNGGAPFPSGGVEIANTTMETYFQSDGDSCMDCHQTSNQVKPMAITFKRLQDYLNGFANNANLDPANSGHGIFWNTTYQAFITGTVPSKHCNGQVVPIIDPVNKANSAFNQILRAGWCNMPQMPKTGPYVTDANYSITLADGTKVTGVQILKDIQDWLNAGAPENG
jgi:hypothetical protein